MSRIITDAAYASMTFFNPFGLFKKSISLFDIRLESDLIVLNGSEGRDQLLKGTVVLCLSSPLKIEEVSVQVTRELKARFKSKTQQSSLGRQLIDLSPKSMKFSAENYEWPFQFAIPLADSLYEAHVVYNLMGTLARGGITYDLHAARSVRIMKTLHPSLLELYDSIRKDNIWPNKIEYSFSIPRKTVIFGSSIEVEMMFLPLLKGLIVDTIQCTLMETCSYSMDGSYDGYVGGTKDIANWEFKLNEQKHYCDRMNEVGQDGWLMKESLPLPKSLKLCTQDVVTNNFEITHKLMVAVFLENPDGHVSEIRWSVPITILISQNMLVNDSGEVCYQWPLGFQLEDNKSCAPPAYDDHLQDRLHYDIDHSTVTHSYSGLGETMIRESSELCKVPNYAVRGVVCYRSLADLCALPTYNAS